MKDKNSNSGLGSYKPTQTPAEIYARTRTNYKHTTAYSSHAACDPQNVSEPIREKQHSDED